jgi:hypothetical protein
MARLAAAALSAAVALLTAAVTHTWSVAKARRHTYPDLQVSAGAAGFGGRVVVGAVFAVRVGVGLGERLGLALALGAPAMTGAWPATPMPAAPPSVGSGPPQAQEPVTRVSPAIAMAQSVLAARAISRSSDPPHGRRGGGVDAADTLSDLHAVRSRLSTVRHRDAGCGSCEFG